MAAIPRSRFVFIEPSKVGSQHITLIEGYLSALTSSTRLSRSFELVFCASRRTAAALSAATRARIRHQPIPVMDPEKRRLTLKTLVEYYAVMRYLLTLRRGDILFVSCVLPSTLVLLELCSWLLRWRRVFVTLHGEVEGLFDKSLQRPTSFGFWSTWWMRLRRANSTLRLVVIDDFIKRRLLLAYPDKLRDTDVLVVHQPMAPLSVDPSPAQAAPSVCFIGYRTRFKGFEQFMQLSAVVCGADFLAIGNGKVEDVRARRWSPIDGSHDYLAQIARCSVALFPYVDGYTCTLSGAAVDALTAGVHIVATDRPCFVSLREYFGDEMVTIYRSSDELAGLLRDTRWLQQKHAGRARRVSLLEQSKYGLDAVRGCFERLCQVA
jgi:hypothetical protein